MQYKGVKARQLLGNATGLPLSKGDVSHGFDCWDWVKSRVPTSQYMLNRSLQSLRAAWHAC